MKKTTPTGLPGPPPAGGRGIDLWQRKSCYVLSGPCVCYNGIHWTIFKTFTFLKSSFDSHPDFLSFSFVLSLEIMAAQTHVLTKPVQDFCKLGLINLERLDALLNSDANSNNDLDYDLFREYEEFFRQFHDGLQVRFQGFRCLPPRVGPGSTLPLEGIGCDSTFFVDGSRYFKFRFVRVGDFCECKEFLREPHGAQQVHLS